MAENTLQLSQLEFDPDNPRLPSMLQGVTDEVAIIAYLLNDEGLLDLMGSIAENGYAKAEPLLVIPKAGDKYIVVEGNRRLAALKLLSNPDLAKTRKQSVANCAETAKHKPTTIPVIKYHERKEILDYLGYRHITGVKEWDSMAKAKYLKQLYTEHTIEAGDRIFTVLARMIGSKSNYVARLLAALHICEYANEKNYFSLEGVSEESIDFSLITTALSYNNLVKYLGLKSADDIALEGLKEENCKNLFDWMFVRNSQRVTRIGESRALKDLNKIVVYPDALEKFTTGQVSLSEAMQYTNEPNEALFDFVCRARDLLKDAKNCLEQISSEPEGIRDLLEEIKKLSTTLLGGLEKRFSENGADPDVLIQSLKENPELFQQILASIQREKK